MIYLFLGEEQAKIKAENLRDSLLKKKPDASLFKLHANNFSENFLQELSESQGLFENKYIVEVGGLLDEKEIKPIFLAELPSLATSPHIFILVEKKLLKAEERLFEKYAEKIQRFEIKQEPRKNEYNPFALTTALQSGNKKEAWRLFDEMRRREMAAEEIHGILWWFIKKSNMQKYYFPFVSMYHEAHRGKVDFYVELEKWVLGFEK